MAKVEHSVYVLIKDDKPIYVGCTKNIARRMYDHKRYKIYDRYMVIKSFSSRKEALICENGIISFMSIFGGSQWLNYKFDVLSYEAASRANFIEPKGDMI